MFKEVTLQDLFEAVDFLKKKHLVKVKEVTKTVSSVNISLFITFIFSFNFKCIYFLCSQNSSTNNTLFWEYFWKHYFIVCFLVACHYFLVFSIVLYKIFLNTRMQCMYIMISIIISISCVNLLFIYFLLKTFLFKVTHRSHVNCYINYIHLIKVKVHYCQKRIYQWESKWFKYAKMHNIHMY